MRRAEFSEKLDELFDISIPVVEDMLEMDRMREEQAREEDLRFLADQRDPERRTMFVGKERDTDFDDANEDKSLRETRNERMKVKINVNNIINNNNEEEQEEEVTDEDDSADFEPPPKTKKKDNLVTLTINRKRLANATAVTAKRHRIGVTAQRDMLANVINIGGGSVEDFSLSNKTVRKAGADTVKEVAEKIKKYFKTLLNEDVVVKECVIIYYDCKTL